MANLSIAILGLNRISASIGLALRRYMANEGKHTFEIVGYDRRSSAEKSAQKLRAIDRTESRAYTSVQNKDIVVMALSYDEVKTAYEEIARDLRDGVVILDLSPVKQPSLEWARTYLTDEHHVIGMTPIVNTKYLFNSVDQTEDAAEDMFDNGAIMLAPSASSIKEAVDLSFNFATILGGKPTFLDPAEHDALVAFTEGLPSVLGVITFYMALKNQGWDDIRRLTNSPFGALTHHLFDTHPDDLRDRWLVNREYLVRNLDDMIATLKNLRAVLAANDRNAIEAILVETAREYEVWYNQRRTLDWDAVAAKPKVSVATGVMGSLLGGAISERLFGKDKDEDEKR